MPGRGREGGRGRGRGEPYQDEPGQDRPANVVPLPYSTSEIGQIVNVNYEDSDSDEYDFDE